MLPLGIIHLTVYYYLLLGSTNLSELPSTLFQIPVSKALQEGNAIFDILLHKVCVNGQCTTKYPLGLPDKFEKHYYHDRFSDYFFYLLLVPPLPSKSLDNHQCLVLLALFR